MMMTKVQMNKCLGCYRPIKDAPHDGHYHQSCSKKLFGSETPPAVDFGANDLEELAKNPLVGILVSLVCSLKFLCISKKKKMILIIA